MKAFAKKFENYRHALALYFVFIILSRPQDVCRDGAKDSGDGYSPWTLPEKG
jgi:hypothetical protein